MEVATIFCQFQYLRYDLKIIELAREFGQFQHLRYHFALNTIQSVRAFSQLRQNRDHLTSMHLRISKSVRHTCQHLRNHHMCRIS